MNPEEVESHYKQNREEIDQRIQEFKELRDAEDYRIFMELVFVILTSQTSAKDAWKTTEELREGNLLLEGSKDKIEEVLRENSVSYEKNKASYIIKNRKMLQQPTLSNPKNELKIKEKIKEDNLKKTREWLVENIQGISWKGASHFLRNIGYGDNFAIISKHILSQMNELGVIKTKEQPDNKEEYLKMERKLQYFSKEIGIDIQALDLVLWSMKTGEVFK